MDIFEGHYFVYHSILILKVQEEVAVMGPKNAVEQKPGNRCCAFRYMILPNSRQAGSECENKNPEFSLLLPKASHWWDQVETRGQETQIVWPRQVSLTARAACGGRVENGSREMDGHYPANLSKS